MKKANNIMQKTLETRNFMTQFPNVALLPGNNIYPDIQLKKLSFYEIIDILLKPSILLSSTTENIQEAKFEFTLTPEQASHIGNNRDIRNNNKIEYEIQVQLRFCLLQTSCEQEDCFPPNIVLKINDKDGPQLTPKPTNIPNAVPKIPPRPLDVTPLIKISPTVSNTITVQWSNDSSPGYCISAYLVKKLTSSQLLTRMKNKGPKPVDFTRSLIIGIFNTEEDSEIYCVNPMLKVSLLCPLGKTRMSIPCRATTCSHLQCFDAVSYLQMNENKSRWDCPVCHKPADFDDLIIDGYFQEILESVNSDSTDIQVDNDGSWSVQDPQILNTNMNVISTNPGKTSEGTISDLTSAINNGFVDLTLTDSEEGDEPTTFNTKSNGQTNFPLEVKLEHT